MIVVHIKLTRFIGTDLVFGCGVVQAKRDNDGLETNQMHFHGPAKVSGCGNSEVDTVVESN